MPFVITARANKKEACVLTQALLRNKVLAWRVILALWLGKLEAVGDLSLTT